MLIHTAAAASPIQAPSVSSSPPIYNPCLILSSTHLQPLPHPLRQLHLSKLPRIQQTLLAQIDILYAGRVLRRRPGHAARNDNGVRFEDDAVVDDFVDGEGGEVVVFDEGALVC